MVAFVPALTVGAIWYAYTQNGGGALYVNLQSFIIPAMLAGILPALVLSFVFAELLARPIRRIHESLNQLVSGNYHLPLPRGRHGEFGEINQQLSVLSSTLEQAFSQATSEMSLIAAERNKLQTVLNTMSDGVFALDRANRIIMFNRAASELTGRNLASVAGQLAEKVMPFRSQGELVMTRWLTATGSSIGRRRGQWKSLELYRADGTMVTVDVEAIQIDNDPNGIRALITFQDVSKQQMLEDMKVDFVALAAHELRTPLTEVRGYLDILRNDDVKLDRDAKKLVENAFASSQQLAGLVNNLLNVARIEHGELTFSPVPVDWLATLEDLKPTLVARARTSKIKLAIIAPSRLAKIYVDPVSITEVLNNLVNNAIAHTRPNGTIRISAERQGDEIETVVADNGSGIPSSAQARLFTKFYRLEGLKSSHGTGLGLFISKSIIEAHHGKIWVDSIEGKGSRFGFRLPLAKLAPKRQTGNSKLIMRGAHGWIKNHTVR